MAKVVFTQEQEQFIRDNATKLTDKQLAQQMGVTVLQARTKRLKLGLNKLRGRGNKLVEPVQSTTSNTDLPGQQYLF